MARLPGLGRWQGEFTLPPLLVSGCAAPVASPGGPERSSTPAPRRPEQAALLGAAPLPARAGPPRAPGPPRGGGPLSLGAPDSPHSLLPLEGSEAKTEGGKTLLRRAGGRERRLSHPSRSVTAAATTIRAVLLLPTCREDTEHARAETTSG